MRKGMDGDTIALQKAETILKAVPTDPDATIALNPATQATVMNLKNIHDATVMKPNLSEAEKKDLMHDTTIIRRKENK